MDNQYSLHMFHLCPEIWNNAQMDGVIWSIYPGSGIPGLHGHSSAYQAGSGNNLSLQAGNVILLPGSWKASVPGKGRVTQLGTICPFLNITFRHKWVSNDTI